MSQQSRRSHSYMYFFTHELKNGLCARDLISPTSAKGSKSQVALKIKILCGNLRNSLAFWSFNLAPTLLKSNQCVRLWILCSTLIGFSHSCYLLVGRVSGVVVVVSRPVVLRRVPPKVDFEIQRKCIILVWISPKHSWE